MPYRDDSTARDALAEARARRRQLPLFDQLEIASPCGRSWDSMMRTADDRVRSCGACDKHVYDVSGMTVEEVDRLILATDGTACVRYYQRADGSILLADCALGARRRARTRYAAAGVIVAMAAGYAVSQWPDQPPDLDDEDAAGQWAMGGLPLPIDDPPPRESAEPTDPAAPEGVPSEWMGGLTGWQDSPPEISMAKLPAEPPLVVPDLHVELGFPGRPRPLVLDVVDDAQPTPARK
jgi:hypothetical protein